MLSLRDLRRRIRSVKSTQQITRAMKAVAAAKKRRSQEQVVAARPYARRLREVLERVASTTGGIKHPLLDKREPNKVAYILITANRGLCGGFNGNLIRRTTLETKDLPQVSLVAVGRKGRDFFRRRGYQIAGEYVGLGEDVKFGHAQEIASFVIDKYVEHEFDAVYLVYSEFVNVLIQRPTVVKLLPVEPPSGEEAKSVDYIFEPSAEAVLVELLPRYVENSIFYGLLESKASEHSARMTAMESATKNADEMIQKLTLTMNRVRQATITREISEIVGGAVALE